MEGYVWINGSFVPAEEAVVSVFDPGFLFGEGVFTTICVNQGRIECIPLHLRRLAEQCSELGLPRPIIQRAKLAELVQRNKADSHFWRLKLGVTLETQFAFLLPYSMPKNASRLGVYPSSIHSPHSHLKTLSYLDHLQVHRWAKQHHFDDAVLLSEEGFLLEAAFSNVFWIEDQTFYSPCNDLSLLQGIALTGVQEITQNWGWSQQKGKYRLEDLPSQVQLFTCNALTGPRPVATLSGRELAIDLEFSEQLQHAYRGWAVSR